MTYQCLETLPDSGFKSLTSMGSITHATDICYPIKEQKQGEIGEVRDRVTERGEETDL